MFSEFFFIPLAMDDKGYKIINKIWRLLYGSNDEKTNRIDTKLVVSIMRILRMNRSHSDHIVLARMPINLKHRCSIAMIGGNSVGEYIYVLPDGDDMSQAGPEYLTYPVMYQIVTDFIIKYNILQFKPHTPTNQNNQLIKITK
jgi:hypothetical protein